MDGAETGEVRMVIGLRQHCTHQLHRLLVPVDGQVDELFFLFGGQDEDGLLLGSGAAAGGALGVGLQDVAALGLAHITTIRLSIL